MTQCLVSGCTRKADRIFPDDRSKHVCETHLKRWEKTGDFSVKRDDTWGKEVNRKYKERECVHCHQVKKIAAKGLCRACYYREKRTGSLDFQRKGVINLCEIEGCENRVIANGLCDKHRKAKDRYGEVINNRPADWGERQKHHLYSYWNDTKRRETLNLCEEWKTNFWSFVETVKKRPSKDHYLRAVEINKLLGPDNWQWVEGLTEANRKMLNRKKGSDNDKKRLRLSVEEREQIFKEAGHTCEICNASSNGNDCPKTGLPQKSLCIDHNHETGEVRGVLCRSCNVALGHFKDSAELLQAAIAYLAEHEAE